MIIITASIQVTAGTVEEMTALGLEHAKRSRTEPGCITHGLHVSAEDPHRLFFYEEWADRAAVEAHFAVPASREFVRKARLLAQSMSPINMYEASPFAL